MERVRTELILSLFLWRHTSINWALTHFFKRLRRKSIHCTLTFIEWVLCIKWDVASWSLNRWRLFERIECWLTKTTWILSLSSSRLLAEYWHFLFKLISLFLIIASLTIESTRSVRIWVHNFPRPMFEPDLFFPNRDSISRNLANIWSVCYARDVKTRFMVLVGSLYSKTTKIWK